MKKLYMEHKKIVANYGKPEVFGRCGRCDREVYWIEVGWN